MEIWFYNTIVGDVKLIQHIDPITDLTYYEIHSVDRGYLGKLWSENIDKSLLYDLESCLIELGY